MKSCYIHTIFDISYYFIVLHILLHIIITLKSQNLESNKVIIIIILPPHLLSILKLWFNFIFGLNFFFLLFQTHQHYLTQNPTYLGSMGNCLSRKAELPASVVDSRDSPFFTSPLPHCQQPHYPNHTSSTLPPNCTSHLRELCEVLHEINAMKIHPSWIRTLTHVQPIIVESNSKLIMLLNN